jgi:serine/threonine-protein kinase RsbW
MALAPHLASIGHGRRWVAAQAARQGVGPTGLRIVQLLASELIANAVLHGPPGGAVCVRTLRSEDRLRVEVDDADSTTRPRLLTRCHADDGGHGLRLVDRFADRWGYDLHGADGKTVWFEFVLPGSRTDRARRTDGTPGRAGPAAPPGHEPPVDGSGSGPDQAV